MVAAIKNVAMRLLCHLAARSLLLCCAAIAIAPLVVDKACRIFDRSSMNLERRKEAKRIKRTSVLACLRSLAERAKSRPARKESKDGVANLTGAKR